MNPCTCGQRWICPDCCECNDDNATELDPITVYAQPKPSPLITLGELIGGYGGSLVSADPDALRREYLTYYIDRLPPSTLAVINKNGFSREQIVDALMHVKQVEIAVCEKRITPSLKSSFGHIAMIINGIEFGMSPEGWDVRQENVFINSYLKQGRPVDTYQIDMSPEQARRFVDNLLESMYKGQEYDLWDNSCSTAVAGIFDDAGIPIYDPRYPLLNTVAPADISRYLYNTLPRDKVEHHPAPLQP